MVIKQERYVITDGTKFAEEVHGEIIAQKPTESSAIKVFREKRSAERCLVRNGLFKCSVKPAIVTITI